MEVIVYYLMVFSITANGMEPLRSIETGTGREGAVMCEYLNYQKQFTDFPDNHEFGRYHICFARVETAV